MFSIDVYENYFQALCGTGQLCDEFYPIDDLSQNVLKDLKSDDQNGIVLVLFQPVIKSYGANIDTVFDKHEAMIFVIQKFNNKVNERFERQKENRVNTFSAINQIRQAMINIARSTQCHFLKTLDQDSIKFHRIGPVFEHFYGWSMEFDFNVNIDNY